MCVVWYELPGREGVSSALLLVLVACCDESVVFSLTRHQISACGVAPRRQIAS